MSSKVGQSVRVARAHISDVQFRILLLPGEISNEMFALLCRLEKFDLSGNKGIDQSTLTGYLGCTMKNLKDAARIDASDKGLKGACVGTYTCALSGSMRAERFTTFALTLKYFVLRPNSCYSFALEICGEASR